MTNSRALLLPLLFLCRADAGQQDQDCHGCKASPSLDDSVSFMQLSKMSVNRKQSADVKETTDPKEAKEPTAAAKVLKLAADSVSKKDAEAAVESVTKQDPRNEAKSLEQVLRLAAGDAKQEQVPLPAVAPCVTTPGPVNIPGMPAWVHAAPGAPMATPYGASGSPCDVTVPPLAIAQTPPPVAVPCAATTPPALPCAPTTQPCPTPKPPSCFSEGLPGDMENFKIDAVRESNLYGARDYYQYTIYIGGQVEQRRIGYPDFFYNLGKHTVYNGMTEEFTNGDTDGCSAGQARSATVHYQQGPPGGGNMMLWNGEVTECHYEFYVQIDPNLCHPGLKKINVIVGYNVLPPEPTPCVTTTGFPCGVTDPPGPPLGNLTIVIPPPLHVPAAGQVAIPAQVPEYTLVPLTTTPAAVGQLVPAQVPVTILEPTMVPVTAQPPAAVPCAPTAPPLAASPCATVPGVIPPVGTPPVAQAAFSPFGGGR